MEFVGDRALPLDEDLVENEFQQVDQQLLEFLLLEKTLQDSVHFVFVWKLLSVYVLEVLQ